MHQRHPPPVVPALGAANRLLGPPGSLDLARPSELYSKSTCIHHAHALFPQGDMHVTAHMLATYAACSALPCPPCTDARVSTSAIICMSALCCILRFLKKSSIAKSAFPAAIYSYTIWMPAHIAVTSKSLSPAKAQCLGKVFVWRWLLYKPGSLLMPSSMCTTRIARQPHHPSYISSYPSAPKSFSTGIGEADPMRKRGFRTHLYVYDCICAFRTERERERDREERERDREGDRDRDRERE